MCVPVWAGLVCVAVLCAAVALWLPEWWCYENGPVEYMQMAVLVCCLLRCCFAEHHRELFYWGAGLLLLFMLREVNCGRTLFLQVPDAPHTFRRWSEVSFGWLVQGAYVAMIGAVVCWFFMRRLYRSLWQLWRMVPVPMGLLLICLSAMGAAQCWESMSGGFRYEEPAELTAYATLFAIICHYAGGRKAHE